MHGNQQEGKWNEIRKQKSEIRKSLFKYRAVFDYSDKKQNKIPVICAKAALWEGESTIDKRERLRIEVRKGVKGHLWEEDWLGSTTKFDKGFGEESFIYFVPRLHAPGMPKLGKRLSELEEVG